MTMRQQYYTSCRKGYGGSAGFQVKAMSPGIGAEEQQALNKILNYRIPPSLEPTRIDKHPVALRYKYLDRSTCILLCSQSNGPDEGGRPGNYFAHSVITSPTDFDVFAPIMYWRHEFWRTEDPSDSLTIPEKSSFALDASLDFETIWPFLDEGSRRDWLYKLLCAVLRWDRDSRRVVILDDTDNIALWIAAVTFALPRTFRGYLSFATYHHDPYQAPFVITGTTADSQFRFSNDEFISYFVLDASRGRISNVDDSAYATFVCQNYTADWYSERLIDFFEYCSSALRPGPQNLADKLDAVTDFYLTVREKSLSLQDAVAQDSLQSFMERMRTEDAPSQDKLADLIATADLYLNDLASSPTSPFGPQYANALRLLKTHDPHFLQRAKGDLELVAGHIAQGLADLPEQLIPVLNQVYGLDTLTQVASRNEFLSSLNATLLPGNWTAHVLLWQHLGPLMRFDASTTPRVKALMHRTLALIDSMSVPQGASVPPEKVQRLLALMVNTDRTGQMLLDSAASWYSQSPGTAFVWAYYAVVGRHPLDKRAGYRSYTLSRSSQLTSDELIMIELQRDVRGVNLANLIPFLESWIQHTAEQPQLQSLVASRGLGIHWSQLNASQRCRVAEEALLSPLISRHLDGPTNRALVSGYLAGLRLQVLEPRAFKLVQNLSRLPGLTSEHQAIMKGAFALTTGRFQEKSIPQIRSWLAKLDREQYTTEAGKLMARFFEPGTSVGTHLEMLQSIYVPEHQRRFWSLYWKHFEELLLNPRRTDQVIALLSFWFDEALPIFSDLPHVGPSFFMQLPQVMEKAGKARAFRESSRLLAQKARACSWYPLLRPYLTEGARNRGLFRRRQ